jgi:hypothetical protein
VIGLGVTEYQPERPEDQDTLRALLPALLPDGAG